MSGRTRRLAALGAAAVVLVCAVVVVGSRLAIGHGSLGNLASGGLGGSGGTGGAPPRVTSIILDVSGSPGDIHVLSATISTAVTVRVATSDPNYPILEHLAQPVILGSKMVMRTMYLHYTYSDGSTKQYTLNGAFVSTLTVSPASSSGPATATVKIKAQSVSSS